MIDTGPEFCTRPRCRDVVGGPWPDLCPRHGARLDEMMVEASTPETTAFLKALAARNAAIRRAAQDPQ